MLDNEAYTGAVVWGAKAKDGAPPVRVEDAHPAIISKGEFQRVKKLLGSRAPKRMNPRRARHPCPPTGHSRDGTASIRSIHGP